MSLFNFIEESIQENKDLLLINYENPLTYGELLEIYYLKEKRYNMEMFLEHLFIPLKQQCSYTIEENNKITEKIKKICQISQRKLNLTLYSDILEKVKYADRITQNNETNEKIRKICDIRKINYFYKI